jgi:pyruvate/2-oxoglutarate dehydrogenase complex dihydrolipoamide dehydrogenase (E3) component
MKHYDAIIIGTGQAGPALASQLAGSGLKTAIIERGRFGGTCVNTGCTPTKALVASAKVAHMARRAAEYGVRIDGPIQVDMSRVKLRKNDIVQRSSQGVEKWLRSLDNLDVYVGHARFEDSHTVRVGEELLTADSVYINVGTRASAPSIPGLDGSNALNNADMLDLAEVPEHLVIIGGSYVGLEFGQIFRRFGSRVTIVEMQPRLIAREDAEVSAAVQAILEVEGIDVRTGAECVAVESSEGAVSVSLDCTDESTSVTGTHLLVATGRQPNTDDLGIELTSIELDNRGYIRVDDELETSEKGVWALGDVNGRGAFTHTAFNDFEIVADNRLRSDSRRVSDRIPVYALYVDPPLARVGMSEDQARVSGRNVLVARRSMARVSRAVEKGETQGFMKILVDEDTKDVLGFTILGVGGDEVAHSVLDVMYAKAPYTVIQRAVHIHPTVSELIPTLLGDLKPLGTP